MILISCAHSCGVKTSENGDNVKLSQFALKPHEARLITSDIDVFWKSFDELIRDTTSNPFEQYLKRGSPGLKDFIPDRIESAKALKSLVLSEKEYYQKIRMSSYKIRTFEKRIRASFYAIEYLYPRAVYPPVYFLIGRTTSGGTASKNGLMIALEVYSDGNYMTNYGRPSLDIEILPNVIVHELIHFLQKDNDNDKSLLKHCIREGSADFIAELTSGEKVKYANGSEVYSYGDANEKELWLEFKQSMNSTELSPWLYSSTENGRPQNLGYWMGYKIVESFYAKAKDKHGAIDEILNIEDYTDFLDKSNYSDRFE